MKSENRTRTLSKISLKSRLALAFTFTTFFPTIILVHYSVNAFPLSGWLVGVLCFIIMLGWWFVFQSFATIATIQTRSEKAIHALQNVDVTGPHNVKDEVQRLDAIFNIFSSKVKESVDALREVNRMSEELNKEIAKKVNIFSSVLQANVLFSKGEPSDFILRVLTDGVKEAMNAHSALCVIGIDGERSDYTVFSSGIKQDTAHAILDNAYLQVLLKIAKRAQFDFTDSNAEYRFLKERIGFNDCIINPIQLRNKIIGYVLVGNCEGGMCYSAEDLEVLELFSHNMSIVCEHKRLAKKVQDLEILDDLAGIYNDKFFFRRLDEEIERVTTYQRPCGLLVLSVDNFDEFEKVLDQQNLEKTLRNMVRIIKDNVRPIDVLGRIRNDKIGIILIERNKRQSQYFGSKLKEALYVFLKEAADVTPKISYAVAENPLDGANAVELFDAIESKFREE